MTKKAAMLAGGAVRGDSSLAFDYLRSVVARDMQLTYSAFGVRNSQHSAQTGKNQKSTDQVAGKKKSAAAD